MNLGFIRLQKGDLYFRDNNRRVYVFESGKKDGPGKPIPEKTLVFVSQNPQENIGSGFRITRKSRLSDLISNEFPKDFKINWKKYGID